MKIKLHIISLGTVTRKGLGPRWVYPRSIWNVQVLEFMQDMSEGTFESAFIKAGDTEMKKGLEREEGRSQQQEWASAELP